MWVPEYQTYYYHNDVEFVQSRILYLGLEILENILCEVSVRHQQYMIRGKTNESCHRIEIDASEIEKKYSACQQPIFFRICDF